jgi:Flp pilus assembly protein TadB
MINLKWKTSTEKKTNNSRPSSSSSSGFPQQQATDEEEKQQKWKEATALHQLGDQLAENSKYEDALVKWFVSFVSCLSVVFLFCVAGLLLLLLSCLFVWVSVLAACLPACLHSFSSFPLPL